MHLSLPLAPRHCRTDDFYWFHGVDRRKRERGRDGERDWRDGYSQSSQSSSALALSTFAVSALFVPGTGPASLGMTSRTPLRFSAVAMVSVGATGAADDEEADDDDELSGLTILAIRLALADVCADTITVDDEALLCVFSDCAQPHHQIGTT